MTSLKHLHRRNIDALKNAPIASARKKREARETRDIAADHSSTHCAIDGLKAHLLTMQALTSPQIAMHHHAHTRAGLPLGTCVR